MMFSLRLFPEYSIISVLQMVWHSGGCPGVSSLIGLFPDLKAVITIQSSAGTKHTANSLVFAEILTSILGSSKDAYKAQM
jgi:hypothetical protein